MKQILINAYQFEDFLNDENKILDEWKDIAEQLIRDEFKLQLSFKDDRFKEARDMAEEIQLFWTEDIHAYILNYYKDKIIQDIINYNYLYDEDGNILGRVEEFDDMGRCLI